MDDTSNQARMEDERIEQGAVAADPQPAASPETELTQALAELRQWKDRYLRCRADHENYVKRSSAEREDALRFANAGFARRVLTIVDDLDRTLEASRDQRQNASTLIDGVVLVRDNFAKVLKEFDVERIESEGRPFDPRFHEALMQQVSPAHAPGDVVQEVQKGYRMGDRVLRPAKVIVAKAPEIADE